MAASMVKRTFILKSKTLHHETFNIVTFTKMVRFYDSYLNRWLLSLQKCQFYSF